MLKCLMIMAALAGKFSFLAWKQPGKTLILRYRVSLSSLHPESIGAITVGDKILGLSHGAALRRWFCNWQHLILGVTSILAVLSSCVDWILPRHDLAQAATDVAFSLSCSTLLVATLLCNRVPVTKRVLGLGPPV